MPTSAAAAHGTVPPPARLAVRGVLAGVSSPSARNVWAVGFAGGKTLIVHRGGARRRRVPSPSPATCNSLFSVSATGARSVWAVGSAGSGARILHWDGRAWRR
ncbi:MAG TPA: hypothetical protein VFQ44_23745 [Streptosporangiaceae bacterium]|nr:hypothetical protein [Streptosporangiaceae bacterium]